MNHSNRFVSRLSLALWLATLWLATLWFAVPCSVSAQTVEPPQEPPPVVPTATLAVHLVLVKIDSYAHYKEIREATQRMEGVYRIAPRSETRDLVTLEVEYSDSPEKLTQHLQRELGGRFTVTQKTLPSGVTEINITR